MTDNTARDAKPSKQAITSMLSEIESTQKRAAQYLLLAVAAALAVGTALIFYTVRVKMQQVAELDRQIAEKGAEAVKLEGKIGDYNDLIAKCLSSAPANVREAVISQIESNANVADTTPRVYVHIYDEGKRKKAQLISQALQNYGYIVAPDIDKRPDKVQSTEVRYFRPDDQTVADKIVGDLKGLKEPKAVSKLFDVPGTKPGQIEVWFSPTPKPAPPPLTSSQIEIRDKANKIIVDELGVDVSSVKQGARLVEDLGADELDRVELVMRFEEEFGIEIKGEDAEKFKRVGDIYQYLFAHVQPKK